MKTNSISTLEVSSLEKRWRCRQHPLRIWRGGRRSHHSCIRAWRFASITPKLGIFVWGRKGNQFTFRKET